MTEKKVIEAREKRHERSGLVWPILLIATGFFFLLSNVGVISFDFWEAVARLWPIALIAVGLDLLIGRRSTLISLLIALFTLALLIAGFFWVGGQDTGGAAVTDSISQPLSGAESAEVDINFGVGRLQLGALPAGAEELIAGAISRPSRRLRVEQSFDVEDGVAQYELQMRGSSGPFSFFGRSGEDFVWDLQLSRDVPIRLTASTGVGESHLDLRQLNLSSLSVDTGVGQTTVTLPGEGQLEVSIDGGVGELIIEIPEGVAARIESDTGLGNTQIDSDYQRDGDVYISPGYDEALDRINLDIDAGIGQVIVRTYGGR